MAKIATQRSTVIPVIVTSARILLRPHFAGYRRILFCRSLEAIDQGRLSPRRLSGHCCPPDSSNAPKVMQTPQLLKIAARLGTDSRVHVGCSYSTLGRACLSATDCAYI